LAKALVPPIVSAARADVIKLASEAARSLSEMAQRDPTAEYDTAQIHNTTTALLTEVAALCHTAENARLAQVARTHNEKQSRTATLAAIETKLGKRIERDAHESNPPPARERKGSNTIDPDDFLAEVSTVDPHKTTKRLVEKLLKAAAYARRLHAAASNAIEERRKASHPRREESLAMSRLTDLVSLAGDARIFVSSSGLPISGTSLTANQIVSATESRYDKWRGAVRTVITKYITFYRKARKSGPRADKAKKNRAMQRRFDKNLTAATRAFITEATLKVAKAPGVEETFDHHSRMTANPFPKGTGLKEPSGEFKAILDAQRPSSSELIRESCPYVTEEEVRLVLKESKASSKPGFDGITNGHLKALGHGFCSATARYINAINRSHGAIRDEDLLSISADLAKKPGASSLASGDFRPIALSTTRAKLVDAVFLNRFTAFVDENKVISTWQKGFRKGVAGVQEAIFTVQTVAAHSNAVCKDLLALFVDVKAAFPSLPHEVIMYSLEYFQFPYYMINYVRQVYSRSCTSFRTAEGFTPWINIERGVLQGMCMSGMLYLIGTEFLLRYLSADITGRPKVGYKVEPHPSAPRLATDSGGILVPFSSIADDMVVFAESPEGLTEAARRIEVFSSWSKLALRPDKCLVVAAIFDKQRRLKRPEIKNRVNIKIGGVTIPITKDDTPYRYLGDPMSISAEVSRKGVIASVVKKFTDNLATLDTLPILPHTKLKVLSVCLLPALEFSLRVSSWRSSTAKSLDVCIRRSVRRWLRLPTGSPNAMMYVRSKQGGLGLTSIAQRQRVSCVQAFMARTTSADRNIRTLNEFEVRSMASSNRLETVMDPSKMVLAHYDGGTQSATDGELQEDNMKTVLQKRWDQIKLNGPPVPPPFATEPNDFEHPRVDNNLWWTLYPGLPVPQDAETLDIVKEGPRQATRRLTEIDRASFPRVRTPFLTWLVDYNGRPVGPSKIRCTQMVIHRVQQATQEAGLQVIAQGLNQHLLQDTVVLCAGKVIEQPSRQTLKVTTERFRDDARAYWGNWVHKGKEVGYLTVPASSKWIKNPNGLFLGHYQFGVQARQGCLADPCNKARWRKQQNMPTCWNYNAQRGTCLSREGGPARATQAHILSNCSHFRQMYTTRHNLVLDRLTNVARKSIYYKNWKVYADSAAIGVAFPGLCPLSGTNVDRLRPDLVLLSPTGDVVWVEVTISNSDSHTGTHQMRSAAKAARYAELDAALMRHPGVNSVGGHYLTIGATGVVDSDAYKILKTLNLGSAKFIDGMVDWIAKDILAASHQIYRAYMAAFAKKTITKKPE
jgi:hypothetical protein